MTIYSRKTD